MIRLYVNSFLGEGLQISLQEAQSHYVQKVMRLKEGAEVLLFNGRDGEWRAILTAALKKSTILLLLSQTRPQQPEGDIWLLFSPLKSNRQAFLEEKATELGASCLWPVRCERTSVLKVNGEKMETHGIEAAEQSERLTVPVIKPFIPLSTLLTTWPQDRLLLFGDETLSAPSLASFPLSPQTSYAFLVGPEGGFSPSEHALLKDHQNTQGVSLNANILRAETAALVGLSYLYLKQS